MNTKPTTIQDILSENSIRIPKIQRDYAQGRSSLEIERIRNSFLSVLYDSLVKEEKPITLDFIYGDMKNGSLIPLDGQQRLTTLYLLYWYIAKHENVPASGYGFLKNFTYETRFTSERFCKYLVDLKVNFPLPENLSDFIRNQSWFAYDWEYDPTIQSVLVMLDTIHEKFRNESNIWNKLAEKRYISFYCLYLEKMGLTDDLYIKMNSRGKPLTEFEHFKAKFEESIQKVSIPLYDEIKNKIDREWTDLLWNASGGSLIDDKFMHYFRFISELLCFRQGVEYVNDDFLLIENLYSPESATAKDNINYFKSAMDCWLDVNLGSGIKDFFQGIFYSDAYESGKVNIFNTNNELNLFLSCCNTYTNNKAGGRRTFQLRDTLLLYAVIQYLISYKDKITPGEFTERIRIIRNLINNSEDEIREDRMKVLLDESDSIVSQGIISIESFGYNENQKRQEIEKQAWLLKNDNKRDSLFKLEDHSLLRGSIDIIGLEHPELFEKFILLFDNADYGLINRALLTFGDYSQSLGEGGWRNMFGRGNTWRELFTKSNRRGGFENTKEILWHLLSVLPGNNIETYLNSIIETYITDEKTEKTWCYYFVKYPCMNDGRSGMYCRCSGSGKLENTYEIIMMNTPYSLTGYHWDPFLYVLSKELSDIVIFGNYNDPLKIKSINASLKCFNNRWELILADGTKKEYYINQDLNNIDIEDRLDKAREIIKNIETQID
jgi:hypothetical protein